MWRYHELLPARQEQYMLTLGEGMTPLLSAPHLAPQGLESEAHLLVKDEGQNPTGSFKARGMAAAVSCALELGISGVATPTAGNAGAALAAIYPASGGTGVVGMWKAFAKLRDVGWLTSHRLPRMIIVQAEGCAPLVRAFHRGLEEAETWPAQEAHTKAAGLRVPSTIGDRLILQAVRESSGTALTVSDDAMTKMVYYTAQQEGMLISLEAAATVAAYHSLLATHFLEPGDETVLFFTGSDLPDIGNYSH